MREHEAACTGFTRDDASLFGREMPVSAGFALFGREIRRFTHDEVRAARELDGVVAHARVHDEREALTRLVQAHVVEMHDLAIDLDLAIANELFDGGSFDPCGGELFGEHRAAIVFGESIAKRLDSMIEPTGDDPELPVFVNDPLSTNGPGRDACDLVVDRGVSHAFVEDLPRSGIMHLDFVWHTIEADALMQAREAQAMIAVEMRDENAAHLSDGDLRINHLPLRALARIEEQAFLVPSE